MSDITMCSGLGCDLKHECYRHTANKPYLQSFFIIPPIKDGDCDMFWSNKAEKSYDDLKDRFKSNE
jgi:hypothetical protein